MSNNKDIGGWLRKKGHRLHTWSRKWFILHETSLMMYSKEGDSKCLDTIHLDKQTIVEPPVDLHDPKQGYFDIVNGNETISLCADTLEEKQIWLRAMKRVLYAKRGGALFSQSLEEILFWEKSSGRRVPYIVDECVQYLYKYGLDVEGIFRLGGRLAAIKDVIARFDQGEKIEFEKEETDIHVVASVLKAFLRDLPDSIIPCQFYQKFMNIAFRFIDAKSDADKEICVCELIKAVDLIPDDNYVILKYVCNFLKKVSIHEENNKMTMMNLGTIFGNNILRHIDKDNSQLLLCTADLGQNLVFMLLNYLPQVFVRELKEEEEAKNSNVATADLLHLTDAPDNVTPTQVGAGTVCEDLAGLDLNTNRTSNGAMPVVEDYTSTNSEHGKGMATTDSDYSGNKEIRAKKRTLHLSLKRRPKGETNEGLSVPPDMSSPPIPPRRNKLTRNRPVSDRNRTNRPRGVHLSAGSRDSSPSPQSPKSEFYTPPQTPSSVDGSVPRIPSSNDILPNREYDSDDAVLNRCRGDENSPTYEELLSENNKLKDEIAIQKERYKKDVSALRSQHMSLNQKYENRISTMEACFENQKKELEIKLEQEKINVVAAVDSTMLLKAELMKYQLKYGELPST